MGYGEAFEPGQPAWIDLESTAGTIATQTFYCRLFAWRVSARHRPLDDNTGYWIFHQDDLAVGGVAPGQQPMWSMYISTVDIAATVRDVAKQGGKVLTRPTAVWTAGTMAVCLDPLGARFALWQPGDDAGAEVMGKPNSFSWGELSSPDVVEAERFYNSVFGWEAKSDGEYTEFVLPSAGCSVTGMIPTQGSEPPAWMVYFAVADVDAIATRTAALGGTVVTAPHPHPTLGRTATLQDPSGAPFAIAQHPA